MGHFQVFLTFFLVAIAYQSNSSVYLPLMVGNLAYGLAVFMELHLLNSICLSAIQKVRYSLSYRSHLNVHKFNNEFYCINAMNLFNVFSSNRAPVC